MTSPTPPSPPSSVSPKPLPSDEVLRLAGELGFANAGVTDALPTERPDFFHQWLNAGHHGQMHYLANHVEKRLDPRKLLPGAQSIIAVADLYHPSPPPLAPATPTPPPTPTPAPTPTPTARFARYAHGDDYHIVMKKRLHNLSNQLAQRYPGHAFKTTVDTAPIMERDHAVRAGLGWIGKHTLLIHPKLGSWMLLGEIVTTLPIMPTDPFTTNHCGTCTRCIDACPTQCIAPEGYALDAERCISYLTLEHRTRIDPQFHQPMGHWIGGCDICQDVCPHNSPKKTTTFAHTTPSANATHTTNISTNQAPVLPDYAPRKTIAHGLSPLDVLNWTAEDRTKIFSKSALKRIKIDMLKRNALIALGNFLQHNHDTALLQRVKNIATSDSEMALVQQTAQDVIDRLMSTPVPTDSNS